MISMTLLLMVFLAIIAGTVFGMVFGVLPGLGSAIAVTIALPFTYAMDPLVAIGLVLAIYSASVYGGSVTAILINTPGTPQSAATVLDGYPMTQKGKADYAMGWTTMSSFIGGIISTMILAVSAPLLAQFALKFGPIQTFALICLAMTCVVGVSGDNLVKGLAAGILGILLAVVGTDELTGIARLDFGNINLQGGVGFIPVLIGLFAISEVLWRAGRREDAGLKISSRVGMRFAPFSEWFARKKTIVRSAILGTFIGILPGVGATTASFVSYSEAKRTGRFKENFGKGEPEGVIASETANNAVTGGALVPTLALGIPGDPVTAIIMAALIMQGIQPGPGLLNENPDLFRHIFMILIAANVAMLVIAIYFGRLVSYLLKMPTSVLQVLIVILSVVGAYSVGGKMFDVMVMLIVGVLGYLFRLIAIPLAPIVIGMVLGPMLETSLRQGLVLTDNDFLAFFSWNDPISLVLFGATGVVLILAVRAQGKS